MPTFIDVTMIRHDHHRLMNEVKPAHDLPQVCIYPRGCLAILPASPTIPMAGVIHLIQVNQHEAGRVCFQLRQCRAQDFLVGGGIPGPVGGFLYVRVVKRETEQS
jgi:hypothetical protein